MDGIRVEGFYCIILEGCHEDYLKDDLGTQLKNQPFTLLNIARRAYYKCFGAKILK